MADTAANDVNIVVEEAPVAAPAEDAAPAVAQAEGTVAEAREAFSAGDGAASRAIHDAKASRESPQPEETHGGFGSDFLKSIVFGGIDGIITTFSTLASVEGGSLSTEAAITLGFANLVADGISMGLGDFLSSQAEYSHLLAERKREAWEFDNYPEGEKMEMVELLKGKGFETEDATAIIDTFATKQHKEFFVDFMMTEELGLEIPDDPWGPLKGGLVTLLSFATFGSVPMWVYLILWGAKYRNTSGIFGVSCAATAITLFCLGALQGKISKQNIWWAGVMMTINGSIASAAAFFIGWGMMKAVGNGEGEC